MIMIWTPKKTQILQKLQISAKGVQKRTLERSKEDRQRPKRDSLNYAASMFRIKPEVSRLRIASERAGSFWSPMKSPQSSAGY